TEPPPGIPIAGVLAAPGTYTVSLARRIDGVTVDLEQVQSFEVTSVRQATLAGSSQSERVAFLRRADELKRATKGSVAAVDEAVAALEAIKDTLARSTAGLDLYQEANALAQRAQRLRMRLAGSEAREQMGDPGPVSIQRRIDVASLDATTAAHGPTGTQRRSLEIAQAEFEEVRPELDRLIDVDLAALQRRLSEAGVPWTPGRGLPIAGQ
ncbi:MAG TPA: hypothetical protein VLD39_07590, partial [Gammaproteobacteria bacterium]|nr:hypothetical protein [Gammaproteobacteria bacterium]